MIEINCPEFTLLGSSQVVVKAYPLFLRHVHRCLVAQPDFRNQNAAVEGYVNLRRGLAHDRLRRVRAAGGKRHGVPLVMRCLARELEPPTVARDRAHAFCLSSVKTAPKVAKAHCAISIALGKPVATLQIG